MSEHFSPLSGYSVTEAYDPAWAESGSWEKPLDKFGKRQNQINQGTALRLRTLESENAQLRTALTALTEQVAQMQSRHRQEIGEMLLRLDRMNSELQRQELLNRLNSRAIDDLLKGKRRPAEAEEA